MQAGKLSRMSICTARKIRGHSGAVAATVPAVGDALGVAWVAAEEDWRSDRRLQATSRAEPARTDN